MSKIIVSKIENRIFTCLFDGFDLKRISVVNENKESILDNIYVAKVKNIVKNINAAFVEISNGIMCYMELKKNTNPIFLNYKKDNVLKVGDEILVQVIKEAQQKKEPVVTSNISIKGDNIILTHGKNHVGISNKIKNDDIRTNIMEHIKPFVNDNYGFVVRTRAEKTGIEYLLEEIEILKKEYEETLIKAQNSTCFVCIRRNLPEYIVDIKEMLSSGVEEIVIEDDTLYGNVFEKISHILEKNNINLRHYDDLMLSLNKLYSIESNIESLLKEKVWLKSGGNIVIQQTEALTAIDVNTSKAIKIKGDAEKTFFKVNLEAAKEIASQLALRNIGGIIIVDFIDMKKDSHKKQLVESFNEFLSKDYVKAMVVDITKLNLVEVTRQKIKQPLNKLVL